MYKDLHVLLLTDQAIITPCFLPPKTHNTETHKILVQLTWTLSFPKTPSKVGRLPACLRPFHLHEKFAWIYRNNVMLLPWFWSIFKYIFLHRYINSSLMAVTMDPKPEKLRENVILKLKNLKVTWKSVAMRCFDLFWPYKIYFQVSTEEKRCMFWSGLSKRYKNCNKLL